MGRIGVVLFLAVGILSVSLANGYGIPGKDFVSKIIDKASSIVGDEKQKDASLDIPENAYPAENKPVPFTCDEDGLYSYPGDCTLGVQCLNGFPTVFTCTDVLHFNNVTKQCDDFCSARCDPMLACICEWDSCNTFDEDCMQDPLRGPCRHKFARYYFDIFSRQCLEFEYGGCGGNSNNFKIKEECENKCKNSFPVSTERALRDDYDSGDQDEDKSEIAAKCIPGELYPSRYDCTQYYQCISGRIVSRTCPTGLHFNKRTETCDAPCIAKCDPNIVCRRGTSQMEKYLGKALHVPDQCLYISNHDLSICQSFDYWNNTAAHSCLDRSMQLKDFGLVYACDVDLFSGAYFVCCPKNASTEISSTEDTDSEEQNEENLRKAPRCVTSGVTPHPYYCNRYFECKNTRIVIRKCPTGLHFNKKTKTCETPCIAKCDPKIDCSHHTSPTAETPLEEFASSDTSKPLNNIFKLKLKFLCFNDGLFPNAKDCSKYINCSNGISYELSCPPGKHFNSKTKKCETPCSAKCDPNLICDWRRFKNEFQVCDWRRFKNEFQEEIINSLIESLCAKDAVFGNPLLCTAYYRCVDGDINAFQCPDGLHFNEVTLQCEEPCDAHCDLSIAEKCGWESTTESKIENAVKESTEELCSKPGVYLEKNPLNCWTYFKCKDGDAVDYLQCPNGQHFNKKTQKCEEPCDAHCDLSMAEKCDWKSESGQSPKQLLKDFDCETDGYHVNPLDCESFIQCFRGDAYAISCPKDLHYSPTLEICTTPCEAKCAPDYEDYCRADEWDKVEKLHRSRSNSEKRLFSPESRFVCGEDGTYAIPDSCSSYIECVLGESFVKFCPEGLHFSKKTLTCETPCEAQCDSSIEAACSSDEDVNWIPVKSSDEPIFDYEMFFKADSPRLMYHFTCMRDGTYKNPENCSTYIQCSGGHSYVIPCPEGLHFNEKLKMCHYPCEAHCDANLACTCNWDTCDEAEYTSDEVDCEVEPEKGPCDSKLPRYAYDVESGRCRGFHYGGCEGNSNNFKTMEECENKCRRKLLGGYRCPSENGMFGHFPDCISYYHCKRGIPTLKRCPKGTAFDHKKSKCVPENEATCVYECRDEDAVYAYEEDCNKYIDCVNGVAKLEKCPTGKAFDPYEKDCVDRNQVDTCF